MDNRAAADPSDTSVIDSANDPTRNLSGRHHRRITTLAPWIDLQAGPPALFLMLRASGLLTTMLRMKFPHFRKGLKP